MLAAAPGLRVVAVLEELGRRHPKPSREEPSGAHSGEIGRLKFRGGFIRRPHLVAAAWALANLRLRHKPFFDARMRSIAPAMKKTQWCDISISSF